MGAGIPLATAAGLHPGPSGEQSEGPPTVFHPGHSVAVGASPRAGAAVQGKRAAGCRWNWQPKRLISPADNCGYQPACRGCRAVLGNRYAGVYDGIEKDSTYASGRAAKEAATEVGAYLLIAVGGGSVIVATRVVAIFMAEPDDPFKIITQYPEGRPAYGPRLLAPKPPITNIPTTPTSAMNRSGAGLKNPDRDHRMEYFDPKTRPQAIFLDEDALLSAPPDLIRSTATTMFAGLVGAMGQPEVNPLAEAGRNHAFLLAYRVYPRLAEELNNPSLRIDFAIAALLQDRAEDDGLRRYRGGALSGNHAVSTALHVRYPHVGQGEATSVIHAAKMRLSEDVDAQAARQVAEALRSGAAGWTQYRPRSQWPTN